jgi:hypothetical protein
MKTYSLKLISLLLLIFATFILSCSANDEKEFMKYAEQMKEILLELKHIKGEIKKNDILSSKDKDAFVINLDKKNEFINSNQNQIDELTSHFEKFANRNSNSIWADDSIFCIAMLYLTISNPGNNYYSSAINYTKFLLKEFPSIHIEGWTKECFNEIPSFKIVFSRNPVKPNADTSNFSQEESIRINLLRAIIYEFLKAGMIVEAKAELNQLKQQVNDKKVIASLEDDISNFERIQSTIKQGRN